MALKLCCVIVLFALLALLAAILERGSALPGGAATRVGGHEDPLVGRGLGRLVASVVAEVPPREETPAPN